MSCEVRSATGLSAGEASGTITGGHEEATGVEPAPTDALAFTQSPSDLVVAHLGRVSVRATRAATPTTNAPAMASKRKWFPVVRIYQQHECGIEQTTKWCKQSARLAREAGADDERVAEVHAWHRGERVVQGANESVVQAEMCTGD